ncbi:MAG TPA: hypothetical protein VJG32_07160 [Anaerolineae bacterium]|nr:hypothetical protein [Anaerolineae bacterium]
MHASRVEIVYHASRFTFHFSRFTSILRRPTWIVLVLSLVITLLPLAWVSTVWAPQGDEPHYLLAAHSLVVDGDLDLANNYAQRDYARFYPDALDRHVRIGRDGRAYLSHDLGLPILISPAYALGGRAGVLVFLAIVAALVAVNVYLLAYEVTSNSKVAVITWLVFSLTPLLSVYAYLVYPEMIGALLVIWAVRVLAFNASRFTPDAPRALLLVSLAVGLLPWLSVRFIPIAAFLGLWSARQAQGDRRRLALALGLPSFSLISYFVVNAWLTGSGSGAIDFNSGSIAHGFQDVAFERLLRGLAGWWLDQQRGLLIDSPVYVVALIGLPLLWRRLRGVGLALLMPLLIAYGLAVAWGGFWIGWEIGARYLVVGLPLLAAPLALALAHVRGPLFRAMVLLTLVISLLNTTLILGLPGIAGYRESIVWIYDRGTPLELWRGLPAMGGGGRVDPDPNAPSTARVVADVDRLAWHTPIGSGGVVIQSSSLRDLTIGSYALRFDARAAQVPAGDSPLLSIDVFSGEGVFLLHRILNGSDFPADGAYRSFALPFESPFYNKWSYPVYAQVTSSGLAETWVSGMTVAIDGGRTWAVTGIWIGLIALAVFAFNRRR